MRMMESSIIFIVTVISKALFQAGTETRVSVTRLGDRKDKIRRRGALLDLLSAQAPRAVMPVSPSIFCQSSPGIFTNLPKLLAVF
ncbi:hypothetical protein JMJ77_0005062 [Colletotrichum scovillei]|uniref:Secreted protein n=1 Tax=Colletotrichum scovillei TaxID=1209932 RepID=A0A9P7RJT2_9PEZI|nr:hypothetical protein JMJ77_0005062 [Colletotrichum scovillei]KAG7076329.1 hypothetical protein JMJ76_0013594 [Colletotrichum scovillei]KAG7083442.1 hypothetical protein JMJ78_0008887 [Colletotrichum scovillei]